MTEIRHSERLWTKTYIVMILYSLFSGIANNMLMTGIPLQAIQLGGSNTSAGSMLGIFMIAAIIVRPYFGMLLDFKGRKNVLLVGVIITALGSISHMLAISIGMLLVLRAFSGVGFSAATNAAGTIMSDAVPSSRLSEGIGYYGVANTLSSAVGPSLSLMIIKVFDFKALFLTASVFGAISLVFAFLINYEKHKPVSEVRKYAKINIKDMLFEKTALPTSLVTVFLALAMGSIMSFIPTYAATRGIDDISTYFTVYAAALLIVRSFAGKLADTYGEDIIIAPGMIILSISFVVLSVAKTTPVFLASSFLYGAGWGSVQPTLNAVMVKLCPAERRGAGNSTFFTAMDIGSGGGAVLWGFISQQTNFTIVYLSCAVTVIVAFAAYLGVLKKQLDRARAEVPAQVELGDTNAGVQIPDQAELGNENVVL